MPFRVLKRYNYTFFVIRKPVEFQVGLGMKSSKPWTTNN